MAVIKKPRARPFDIGKCARPNILALKPYISDRCSIPADVDITLLDANENAFGPCIPLAKRTPNPDAGVDIQSTLDPEALQLHRYPDEQSTALKQLLCDYRAGDTKTLSVDNICLGVGSSESIDTLIRTFCTPGRDKILICPPTFVMYEVSANVNDVGVVRVSLDTDNGFTLQVSAINEALSQDPSVKIVFICSPGSPTGNLLDKSDIHQILEHPTWNGVVVVDEAYIDFAPPGSSMVRDVDKWPNLVVTHSFSKAFGLAAIRLGITYSQPQISRLLNNLQIPYRISSPTVALAMAALSAQGIALMESNRAKIAKQRKRMQLELPKIPGFGKFLGGFQANFLLVQFLSKPADEGGVPDKEVAAAITSELAGEPRILVRSLGAQPGCLGALRITVGTEREVDDLLLQLRRMLKEIYASRE